MQSQCENRKLKAVESDFENVCVTSELLLVHLGVVQTLTGPPQATRTCEKISTPSAAVVKVELIASTARRDHEHRIRDV